MATHRMLLALSLILLICGCTQAPPPAPNQTQPATPAPQVRQWAHYRNSVKTFIKPQGMRVNETLGSYPQSATVLIQSSDAAQGALLVNFVNASAASNLTIDPLEVAVGVLGYDNTSGSDLVLSQADGTGEITNMTTSGGLAEAEMRFTLPTNNVTLYGFAIEMYDKQHAASYPVRILSSDPNQTKALRDRFIDTFRSG